MTSGPEHYRESERLLDRANEIGTDDPETEAIYLQHAQAHATLALAAATALGAGKEMPYADTCAWSAAVTTKRSEASR